MYEVYYLQYKAGGYFEERLAGRRTTEKDAWALVRFLERAGHKAHYRIASDA